MIVDLVLTLFKLLFQAMSQTTHNGPTGWSVAGEIRMSAPQDGETSISPRFPSVSSTNINTQTSECVSSTKYSRGSVTQQQQMSINNNQWFPVRPETHDDSLSVVDQMLKMLKTRNSLAPSSCDFCSPLTPPVEARSPGADLTQNVQQTQNTECLSDDDLRFNAHQSHNSNSAEHKNDCASSSLDCYRDEGSFGQTKLRGNSTRLQQIKRKPNTRIRSMETSSCTKPFVYRVSAKISSVSPQTRLNNREKPNPNAVPSPSEVRNVYFSIKNLTEVPELHNKYVQTDPFLPVCPQQHSRLMSSSPLLPTSDQKKSLCEVTNRSSWVNAQNCNIQEGLENLPSFEKKINSRIFVASDSAHLGLLQNDSSSSEAATRSSGTNLSKCSSNCCLAISNVKEYKTSLKKDYNQAALHQQCQPTKCQITQTSTSKALCLPFNAVRQVSQVTQTEDKELEERNLFPFYLAFRFAYFILNEKHQHSSTDDIIALGALQQDSIDRNSCRQLKESLCGTLMSSNDDQCEVASQSTERPLSVCRMKKQHKSNSKQLKDKLTTTDKHEPKNSRLWYNKSYRRRPKNARIMESEHHQEKPGYGFIPRRTRTYRRRRSTDTSGQTLNSNFKIEPRAMKPVLKDPRVSPGSSSEEEGKLLNVAYCRAHPKRNSSSYFDVGKQKYEANNSKQYHIPPKKQPSSIDKGNSKTGLQPIKCYVESTWPICKSDKPSYKSTKELKTTGKNWFTKTVKSWGASSNTWINFLRGDETGTGSQRHISSTSLTKLLFRKCHSLSSGTLRSSKHEPSSSSTSAVTSDPLIPTATLLSFLTGKAQSSPQPLCSTTISSQTLELLNGSFEKLKSVDSRNYATDIACSNLTCRGTHSTIDSVKVPDIASHVYAESSPCVANSQARANQIAIPHTAETCIPDPPSAAGITSTQSVSAGERFLLTCPQNYSSPDRAPHFQSDSIVAWTLRNSSTPTSEARRWPAQSEGCLEGRLTGGSDRKTTPKNDEAQELEEHGGRSPLIEIPDLDCEPSGADQTVVFTCNECCKSCTSTTGWSCHTSNNNNDCGSGMFVPTPCDPSCCENGGENPVQWMEIFPDHTRHCTSTYNAKGKCEIEKQEEAPKKVPKKCVEWVDIDPFTSNQSNCHEIPPSYDYSYGPNSYYRTGRSSLAAGGQSNRPINTNRPVNGSLGTFNNCGQWWYVPTYQNAWNMNTYYDQESNCGWPPTARWQGWRSSDWWSPQQAPAGPEQTWTAPQKVFRTNAESTQGREKTPDSNDAPYKKRRELIHPSVRKPRLRTPSSAVVRDCGSQVNTLPLEVDDDTAGSRFENPPEPAWCYSPISYRHCFEAGVVFDCSTQTNISKVEKLPGYRPVVHYNVREPRSSPSAETRSFVPSPVHISSCPSPRQEVRSPPPAQYASCPSPGQNHRFVSPERQESSPVLNERFPSPEQIVTYPESEEGDGTISPGQRASRSPSNRNVRFTSPVGYASCPSPLQHVRYLSPVDNDGCLFSSSQNPCCPSPERNDPRGFCSSPCHPSNASPQPQPCSSAQMGELPSEGHDCPQESKNGLVSDVMRSVQGFRNCLNCGTNQNVHYNRKGVYAVRVISNGKESQNKTNQCVHYKWLPSLPWPAPETAVPCDAEVYYDSRTCRSSNEEPVKEKQETVSWKKEFRRRSATKPTSDKNDKKDKRDKRAAGGGSGGKQSLPQEELLSLHSNSRKWGSSYGKRFDVENCLKKDLKRRRGEAMGLPELKEHELCCSQVVDDENTEMATEWNEDSNGEDVYAYYHRYDNCNEANCDLVEEHDEVCEYNRCNELPSVPAECNLSPLQEEELSGSDVESSPTTAYRVRQHVHRKMPKEKMIYAEPTDEVETAGAAEAVWPSSSCYAVPQRVRHAKRPRKRVHFQDHTYKANLSPVQEEDMQESCMEHLCPSVYPVEERVHRKTPTKKKVKFQEPVCETAKEESLSECPREPLCAVSSCTEMEHICQNSPTSAVYFEDCCKATQTPSPTQKNCPQIVSPAILKSPGTSTLIQTEPSDQPDVNITDICITGPSRSFTQCNRCGGTCRPTLLRDNCTCRVKSVVCACSNNNPADVDCSVECGCNGNMPNYNEACNNCCCGYQYYYPNYMNYGCYCCPLMHYHSLACYVMPNNFGPAPFEVCNALPSPRHTPSPAKFKESYKPDDWTPPPFASPEPESVKKEECVTSPACKDENKTFALLCKHHKMNESPSGKITIHDCEISEDSRRFTPGQSCCVDDHKTESGKQQSKRTPIMVHATTSGSPLLEVLAQNEEVIRAAKDCLQRTVNYISVAKGTSGDNLCPRRKNSPGGILPDYWAMKAGLYQKCQVIDKISDEAINLNAEEPPAENPPSCLLNSVPINERTVDSLLLLGSCDEHHDLCDVERDPCNVGRNICEADRNPCDEQHRPCDVTESKEDLPREMAAERSKSWG